MIFEYWASETISSLLKHAAVSGATMPARKAVFVTSKSALARIDGVIESERGGISHWSVVIWVVTPVCRAGR
ncbi:hypothetical protein D9M71_699050 [compost metagenome]